MASQVIYDSKTGKTRPASSSVSNVQYKSAPSYSNVVAERQRYLTSGHTLSEKQATEARTTTEWQPQTTGSASVKATNVASSYPAVTAARSEAIGSAKTLTTTQINELRAGMGRPPIYTTQSSLQSESVTQRKPYEVVISPALATKIAHEQNPSFHKIYGEGEYALVSSPRQEFKADYEAGIPTRPFNRTMVDIKDYEITTTTPSKKNIYEEANLALSKILFPQSQYNKNIDLPAGTRIIAHKSDVLFGGFFKGAREFIATRPLDVAVYFAGGAAIKGAGTFIKFGAVNLLGKYPALTRTGATIGKGLGLGLTGLYVGSVVLETSRSSKPFEYLGGESVRLGSFSAGYGAGQKLLAGTDKNIAIKATKTMLIRTEGTGERLITGRGKASAEVISLKSDYIASDIFGNKATYTYKGGGVFKSTLTSKGIITTEGTYAYNIGKNVGGGEYLGVGRVKKGVLFEQGIFVNQQAAEITYGRTGSITKTLGTNKAGLKAYESLDVNTIYAGKRMKPLTAKLGIQKETMVLSTREATKINYEFKNLATGGRKYLNELDYKIKPFKPSRVNVNLEEGTSTTKAITGSKLKILGRNALRIQQVTAESGIKQVFAKQIPKGRGVSLIGATKILPISKTTSAIIGKNKLNLISIPKTLTTNRTISSNKIVGTPKIRLSQNIITSPKLNLGLGIISTPKIITSPKFQIGTIQNIKSISITTPPPPPPPPPPPVFPNNNLRFDWPSDRRKGRVSIESIFNPRYTSTIAASGLQIRGRKPSKLSIASGLQVRPLIKI